VTKFWKTNIRKTIRTKI